MSLKGQSSKIWRSALCSLTALFPFVIYLRTLAPTITWRDSGDLVTACYVMGIPHPTGYPLFVMLSKLFTFLPVGDIAYRVNLMSAFFAAITSLVIYKILLNLTGKHIPALSAALSMAFSFTFWTQSVIAEVYTLNAFFLSLLILLLLKWRETRSSKFLYLFAFSLGLSFSNHMSTVFILPATITFVLLVDPKSFIKRLPTLLGLFILGLTPYIYLPIRSAQDPPLDWGNPETLKQFIWLVSAAQYRSLMFSKTLPEVLCELNRYRVAILNEFTIIGFFFGVLGYFRLIVKLKEHRQETSPLFLLLTLIFLADIVYTVNYRIPDNPPFYIPSYLIFSIWIGLGVEFLLDTFKQLRIWRRGMIYTSAVLVLSIGFPMYELVRHYPHVDLSDFREAYQFGNSVFKELKPGALVFTQYDGPTFTLWYFRYVVYREREDVRIISMPLLRFDWYRENLKRAYQDIRFPDDEGCGRTVSEMILENLKAHPVYIFFPEEPPDFLKGLKLSAAGPLYRISNQH